MHWTPGKQGRLAHVAVFPSPDGGTLLVLGGLDSVVSAGPTEVSVAVLMGQMFVLAALVLDALLASAMESRVPLVGSGSGPPVVVSG